MIEYKGNSREGAKGSKYVGRIGIRRFHEKTGALAHKPAKPADSTYPRHVDA